MMHLFMALGIVGMAAAIFALGWQSARIWMDWRDDRALRAMEAHARHSHRKGTALVAAHICSLCGTSWDTPDGKCECSRAYAAEPPWLFAGESAQGWASESAEYELLTQTAIAQLPDDEDGLALKATMQLPASVTGEPPIDTGELLAITDRVESWIAQWTAQGNIDRHTIQASDG